ncbi:nicotinamide mononucleotide transporter [bacterium]|nr:nicotinamide mononucleotide transporter [bacterium]
MDNFISIIYAICGISYTVLSGRGKYFCFIFGLISSLLYSILSFKQALWGTFFLNFLYYIPIQILSLLNWHKNTDKKRKTIKKTYLGLKKFLILAFLASILSIILGFILFLNKDNAPYQDGFITIFSMLGAYLTLRRAIEQWIVWTIVNFITLIMWIILIIKGANTMAVPLLWFIYLILGIYFYFKWQKELKQGQL